MKNKLSTMWKHFTKALPLTLLAMLLTAVGVLAGTNLDSPSAPGSTNSYTLEDIYQRLDAGTTASQSTFTEPAVAPGTGTMHDLNDIYNAIPAEGSNVSGADGSKTFNIPDGIYRSNTATCNDADLVAGNILDTATILGVTGSISTGNDIDGADGSKTFNITDGYYSGKTATCNDADLAAENIRDGVEILGELGSMTPGVIAKRVPATGQTVCWGWAGPIAVEIGCSGTGQDGEYQIGLSPAVPPSVAAPYSVPDSWEGERFTDNGDGTVTDNLTALMWLKDAGLGGERDWEAGISYAESLVLGGYDDWRMPNINELHSLGPTWPPPSPFENVEAGSFDYYWSSSNNAGNAWFVQMSDGTVGEAYKGGAYYIDTYVWPVRSGN